MTSRSPMHFHPGSLAQAFKWTTPVMLFLMATACSLVAEQTRVSGPRLRLTSLQKDGSSSQKAIISDTSEGCEAAMSLTFKCAPALYLLNSNETSVLQSTVASLDLAEPAKAVMQDDDDSPYRERAEWSSNISISLRYILQLWCYELILTLALTAITLLVLFWAISRYLSASTSKDFPSTMQPVMCRADCLQTNHGAKMQ